ncbi:MAG: 16S rRNA (guanine(966)-N(2))-methyltransferase RsmD [Clostridia bacterium]|nr:16S rRNA (guanine(966)-N(2))-methyltransferase RsmD [Clostridia bacterium]
MHIIAGERRGATLFAPKGMDTRPTQAKVKESLFNIIQAYVPDAAVLDLFAGSGNLALEALSRGAASAVLVDMDREANACIRRNVEKLRFGDCTQVLRADWKHALTQLASEKKTFDLVFLDPPYKMTELGEICAALADAGLLASGAMMVLEHRTGAFGEPDEKFELLKQRTYGDTEIHFYLYDAEG